MTKRRAIALGLFLQLFAAAALHAQSATADRLLTDVTNIANASGNAERGAAITAILDAEGFYYRLEEFVDRRMRTGTNIVVTIPGSTEAILLIGAHYDREVVGQGALDNGASCAVLLELLRLMKARPLSTYTLRVVFFDLEEGGLSGSQAHVLRQTTEPKPRYGINLDIFGYGNALFTTASAAEGTLAQALTQAAMEESIPLRLFPPEQYPVSDHRSMILAGIEAISMSLLHAEEIDNLVAFVTRQSQERPQLLATIHTANDTLEMVKPAEMEKAIPVLERLLRIVDGH